MRVQFPLFSFISVHNVLFIVTNMFILEILLQTLATLVPMLICIAFFTLAERKVMAAIQRRRGPNVVGLWGLLQPFSDGLKLILKEIIIPAQANKGIFLFAPVLVFSLSLTGWSILPFELGHVVLDPTLGVLYLFVISSCTVYGIILAGWASNSRYALLGALRAASQMISYEVSLGFIILTIAVCAQSLNVSSIVLAQQTQGWYFFPLLPLSIIFFISTLAETNRAPFDLPESEAEVVAGYNVEYSSIVFALFFLGEYGNMLAMASLFTCLFLGGWLIPFLGGSAFGLIIKILVFSYFFILIRAAFPRYRYDQLMTLGWKGFLPFVIIYFYFIIVLVFSF